MNAMHPYILEAVARERTADMLAVAAKHRLAREAAGHTQARRRHLPVVSRRQHSIELVWPDGIRSVVELPRQSEPARTRGRGLAGSRR
jgi:hypothetical protein